MKRIKSEIKKDIAFVRRVIEANLKYRTEKLSKISLTNAENIHVIMDEQRMIGQLSDIINSLGEDGIQKATYGLPLFALSLNKSYISNSYLVLQGIKINSRGKDINNPLYDNVDKKSYDLEKIMGEMITDDYRVDLNRLEEFFDIYCTYLVSYVTSKNLHNFEYSNKSIIGSKICTMVAHIVYRVTGHLFTLQEEMSIVDFYTDDELLSFRMGPASSRACKQLIERYRKPEPSISVEFREPSKVITRELLEDGSNVITIDISAIEPYLENGVVTKICDLNIFEDLLEKTTLPVHSKMEYIAQMRNLINRTNIDLYNSKMQKCREEVLSLEELDLYNKGKNIPEAKTIIESIDTIIEMFVTGVTEEESLMLKEELCPLFVELKRLMTLPEEKIIDVPKVLYFTEDVLVNGETIKTPKVLKGIVALKKGLYKQILIQMNKLLGDLTAGDGILKGDNLPCQIWYNGKDIKVFYTSINGVTIIIDCLKGDQYGDILKTVKSKEFIEFLASVKRYITDGGVIDGSGFTNLIMSELSKSNAVKKILVK